jgi:hypothetical protein
MSEELTWAVVMPSHPLATWLTKDGVFFSASLSAIHGFSRPQVLQLKAANPKCFCVLSTVLSDIRKAHPGDVGISFSELHMVCVQHDYTLLPLSQNID